MHSLPTSLLECDDLVRAATSAEMVYELFSNAANRGLEGEELQEYGIFIGAAVSLVIAELPEYVRPSNISCDVVRLAERCRGTAMSASMDGVCRRGGGAGGGH